MSNLFLLISVVGVVFILISPSYGRIVSEVGDGFDKQDSFKASLSRREDGVGPAKDQDAGGKYIGNYNSDCNEVYYVTPTKNSAKIEPSTELLSKVENRCHWDVVGTDLCTPVLECKKFNLAPGGDDPDDKCKDEYLEVTDGVGGYEKFCGTDGPKSITTTNKLRDLYISLKLGSGSNSRKLKCSVTCSLTKEGTPLAVNFEPTLSDDCHCGRKPNGDRIVGGEDAKKGEFPWIAGLVTMNTRKPYCGGTIINSRFILTAAHCFKGPYMKKKNFQVLLNGHFMDMTASSVAKGEGHSVANDLNIVLAQDAKEGAVRHDVEKYFLHPLYIRQTNDYDVALIKLTEPIDFVKHTMISPACMPDVGSYTASYDGVMATVAGWGLNASDSTQTMGTLQKLKVPVMTTAECKSYFDTRFTRRMICAGFKEGGKDSCKGDSGGPLVAEKSKQKWGLIGAVSWGEGCAAGNSPGVYANIAEIEQWVQYVSNNEDATWCSE